MVKIIELESQIKKPYNKFNVFFQFNGIINKKYYYFNRLKKFVFLLLWLPLIFHNFVDEGLLPH